VPVNTCRLRLRYALLRVRRYDVDYHAREAGLVDFIETRGSAKPDVADPSRIGMPCFRRSVWSCEWLQCRSRGWLCRDPLRQSTTGECA
jgi:hypothetical protein